MSAAIEFSKVDLRLNGKTILKDLSFSLPKNKVTAFLGPNGAGKSTSISLMCGWSQQDRGQVVVGGFSPGSKRAREFLSVTPQDLSFPGFLRVREVAAWVKVQSGHKTTHAEQRLQDLQSLLRLDKVWNQYCQGLSGGERRKLGLFCALLKRHEFLILDEPTTGMDVEARRELWKLLTSMKEDGQSLLLCSHDLSEVETLADELLLLDRGQLKAHGTLEAIKKQVDFQIVEFTCGLDGLVGLVGADGSEGSDQKYWRSKAPQGWLLKNEMIVAKGDLQSVRLTVVGADQLLRQAVKESWPVKSWKVRGASLEEALFNPEDQKL